LVWFQYNYLIKIENIRQSLYKTYLDGEEVDYENHTSLENRKTLILEQMHY